MSKKYFVISDIHGFYSLFKEALDKVGFDPFKNSDHILVVCGDIFDRGDEPYKLANYLMSLPQDQLILVKGNHDDYLEDLLLGRREPRYCDIANGTITTVEDLMHKLPVREEDKDNISIYNATLRTSVYNFLKPLFDKMVDFYETDNYIFVHGYIPVKESVDGYYYKDNWRRAIPKSWRAARWYNGMDLAFNCNILEPNKKIVVGHWHTSYGHVLEDIVIPAANAGLAYSPESIHHMEFVNDPELFRPFEYTLPDNKTGLIAIDGCVAFSGVANVIKLTDN